MDSKDRKIASLESKLDLIEAELIYLNDLLMVCGFSGGVQTLKAVVEEIIGEDSEFAWIKRH